MKLVFLILFSLLTLKSEEIYASFDVLAQNQSKLSLQSAGIVKAIYVNINDKVKKDQVLLKLEDSSEQIALKLAQNEYKLATLALEHAKSSLEKFKKVQEVIDKQSYENVLFEFQKAQSLQQKAFLNIQHYKDLIDKKTLKAPYDGIISNKYIDIGDGVKGISHILFEFFSYPKVKLLLSFDEKFKDKVKIDDIFIYKIDSNEKEYQGKITLIYPSIDIKTRKIYAEVEALNFTPGSFGEGKIITKD
ncbi:efflux RND transporter periplasmic adaptor subunit [Campylobacter lari]|nr:efflux RND transporter periplasmic adaptor subunit [Campylobacter lari]EAK0493110.1 efflux RND transporter periplasmic adaptor subunit [Campylobacter lari]EAK9998261.1 efflux RND transporter periplasmic adaptor subunit [Campylobacter lari]EFO9447397.1 efflux RND transporter periplasmic adaptor subunit [Campylobacter lari]